MCDPDSEAAVAAFAGHQAAAGGEGLILIAADLAQLQDYIDPGQLSDEQLARCEASRPGPFTWIMPARSNDPSWLTGQFIPGGAGRHGHPQVQGLVPGIWQTAGVHQCQSDR